MKFVLPVVLLLLSALHAVGACSTKPGYAGPEVKNLERLSDKGLKAAVAKYYMAESLGSWREAYEFRSSEFRNTVLFDEYVTGMQQGYLGWVVKKVEIVSVVKAEARWSVKIKFYESVSADIAKTLGIGSSRSVVSTNETVWRQVGNKWEVLDAGTRNHVQLNTNLVNE